MTPAVTYINGAAHYACVGAENNAIYYKAPGAGWVIVDPGSHAIGGVSIAGNDANGQIAISYTNPDKNVCVYVLTPGQTKWSWSNLGGSAQ
jgi:hypothetical protein